MDVHHEVASRSHRGEKKQPEAGKKVSFACRATANSKASATADIDDDDGLSWCMCSYSEITALESTGEVADDDIPYSYTAPNESSMLVEHDDDADESDSAPNNDADNDSDSDSDIDYDSVPDLEDVSAFFITDMRGVALPWSGLPMQSVSMYGTYHHVDDTASALTVDDTTYVCSVISPNTQV